MPYKEATVYLYSLNLENVLIYQSSYQEHCSMIRKKSLHSTKTLTKSCQIQVLFYYFVFLLFEGVSLILKLINELMANLWPNYGLIYKTRQIK